MREQTPDQARLLPSNLRFEERMFMEFLVNDFATRSSIVRRAVEARQNWIEEKLGVPLSEAVILETSFNLAQIGVEKILGLSRPSVDEHRATRRLRTFVAETEVPPGVPPMLSYSKSRTARSLAEVLSRSHADKPSRIDWQDCPVAMTLHTVPSPVIVLNVRYQPGPSSDSDCSTTVLVVKRNSLEQLVRLLDTLDRRETMPKLYTHHGPARAIARCEWDDMVLDPAILSLLKDDFEGFWNREDWFRQHHLPFRRGYLLHGSPGNGKSTAVRAMMCSRGLGAYTIRLFDRQTDDGDLDELFENALREQPAMVLLEDLDRAFPRSGEARTQVSLQSLLNSLDGVATGEGIVVVATANEPTALDPAILRRPGRFDRVVHFPNPTGELRRQYFQKMAPEIAPDALDQPISASGGLSFAQLRETFILAAQFALHRNEDVTANDLILGIQTLRQTMAEGSMHNQSAGFVAASRGMKTDGIISF